MQPLRDWSRSSTGKSPAERNREIVAEGFRRAAAEVDYKRSLQASRPPALPSKKSSARSDDPGDDPLSRPGRNG